MDEDYIKMCDCPEIQGQWEPKEGDRYIKKWTVVPEIPNQPDYVCVPYFLRDNAQSIHKPSFVWLPRQSDIQDMLPDGACWFEKHFRFYEWAGRSTATELSAWNRFDSMDQLWLAFYMHTFGKTWTEKGWKQP